MPGVGVPWSPDGFGKSNGESGSRRRDRGNTGNGALDTIRAANFCGGLQPQGESKKERNRCLQMQAGVANPESAHGLKVNGSSRSTTFIRENCTFFRANLIG